MRARSVQVASVIVESVAVLLGTILLVSTALALLPGGEGSWAGRVWNNIVTAFNLPSSRSTISHEPVFRTIGRAALVSSVIIAVTAAVLTGLGGIMGVLVATRSGSRLVSFSRNFAVTLSSLPVLLWATLIFLAAAWGPGVVLAVGADTDIFAGPPNPFGSPAILAAAIVSLLIGDRLLADVIRRVELATKAILAEPYMRTVRAAGLGTRRHMFQGLVPPIAEFLAARAMVLISGAIVVESIFEIRGLGYTVLLALQPGGERDTTLILGASIALVAIGLVVRATCRMATLMADPRTGMADRANAFA